MHLVATVQDRSLGHYAERLRKLGVDGRVVLASTLNAAGDEVRLLTIKAETKQTGLAGKTIAAAQKAMPATASSLSFKIRSEGGNVRLKFFGAKETDGGVVAHPFGQDQVFAHAFMAGGRFPNRVTISKLNGAVIERIGVRGKDKPWSRTVRSGLTIPEQMVTGGTAAAFNEGVATIVATTVVRRLGSMLP